MNSHFRGGLGTYAMEMTRKLVRLGHDVTVFSRNVGRAATRDVWDGIEVHRPILVDLAEILPFIVPEDVRSCLPKGDGSSQRRSAATFSRHQSS